MPDFRSDRPLIPRGAIERWGWLINEAITEAATSITGRADRLLRYMGDKLNQASNPGQPYVITIMSTPSRPAGTARVVYSYNQQDGRRSIQYVDYTPSPEAGPGAGDLAGLRIQRDERGALVIDTHRSGAAAPHTRLRIADTRFHDINGPHDVTTAYEIYDIQDAQDPKLVASFSMAAGKLQADAATNCGSPLTFLPLLAGIDRAIDQSGLFAPQAPDGYA